MASTSTYPCQLAEYARQGKMILYLTLRKEPFDLIVAGHKRVEYRDASDYWKARFLIDGDFKCFDFIEFRNGYSSSSPRILIEWKGMKAVTRDGVPQFAIELGDIVLTSIPCPQTPAPALSAARQPPNIKLARAAKRNAQLEATLAGRIAQINQEFGMTDLLQRLPPQQPQRKLEFDEFASTNWSEDEKARIKHELIEFEREEGAREVQEVFEPSRAAKRIRNEDGWFVPVALC